MTKTVGDVREFWDANPLWTGESRFEPGTREFFEEQRRAVIEDNFAGRLDPRVLPAPSERERVLDLGCGIGLWTVELALAGGCASIDAADLSARSLGLARRRCELYGVKARFSQQNAERLAFADGSFSHVNCQGVIHHTPDTRACVAEIARVLRPGGTAAISVYYRNVIIRNWRHLKRVGRVLTWLGVGLRGRGREGMASEADVDEIVRLYDGDRNPIGKAYSRQAFLDMLRPHLEVEHSFLHFFPGRALPTRLPRPVHELLGQRCGFLILAVGRKPAR